ncbi:MAG: SpoVG family protein [Gracilibacteraceae bacterium]|jgi:stage V sporulation protein G|nr:SpoVG family protein [Gracilibacteraceae bacterium]
MKKQDVNHPSIEVRVYPVSASKNSLLAFASVTLAGCFAVNGIQIMNGKNGVFVAMPSVKDRKGEYRDICFPITAEFRTLLHETILEEYSRSAAQTAAAI